MPIAISTYHINRMFPFEFYDELREQLTGYALYNPAFLITDSENFTKEDRKKIFESNKNNDALLKLHERNIVEIEPYGEVLILDHCCEIQYVKTVLTSKNRSQVPMSLLVCQLYDCNQRPVFSKERTVKNIATIKEVLWDDPNLMIGVVTLSDSEGPTMGVFKIPPVIEDQLFELVGGEHA